MEKKAEDCEEENSELFQLGQDGFNTRKQERRSKVRQLSEKINRESQKPGKLRFFWKMVIFWLKM